MLTVGAPTHWAIVRRTGTRRRYGIRIGPVLRLCFVMPAITMTFAVAVAWYVLRCDAAGYYLGGVELLSTPLEPGFDGPASRLLQTAIVRSLDSAVPQHRNVLWAARQEAGDDAPSSVQLRVAFPTRLPNDFWWWSFHASNGPPAQRSFFGWPLYGSKPIEVLHTTRTGGCCVDNDQIVIDPSPDSTPYQVVLAEVPLQHSLAATVSLVESRVADFAVERRRKPALLGWWMTMAIPSIFFRVRDDGGRTIGLELNAATPANRTEDLVSLGGEFLCVPSHIVFDRPFLLMVRKRGARAPLMVLWVDNPELISPRPGLWPSILHALG